MDDTSKKDNLTDTVGALESQETPEGDLDQNTEQQVVDNEGDIITLGNN